MGLCFLFRCIPVLVAAAKLLQSCPTLCDPIDSSPLGSSVPGILQARTLEWVAIAFSAQFSLPTFKSTLHVKIKWIPGRIYDLWGHLLP